MIHFKMILGATFAAALTLPSFAEGGTSPTHVVELFTSQGCSSCPPANKFVGKLTEDPNVLVLSYGVTYWDYLGWKDTFGDPAFTQRQREYRDAFGAPNIYTPQIVLGGSAHSPRYSRKDVETMPLEGDGAGLRILRDGTQSCFTAKADGTMIAEVVTFTPGAQEVAVKRGENGGRTLELTNVVTAVTDWPTHVVHKEFCVTPKPNEAYAALIHDKATARIIDAAVIRPK